MAISIPDDGVRPEHLNDEIRIVRKDGFGDAAALKGAINLDVILPTSEFDYNGPPITVRDLLSYYLNTHPTLALASVSSVAVSNATVNKNKSVDVEIAWVFDTDAVLSKSYNISGFHIQYIIDSDGTANVADGPSIDVPASARTATIQMTEGRVLQLRICSYMDTQTDDKEALLNAQYRGLQLSWADSDGKKVYSEWENMSVYDRSANNGYELLAVTGRSGKTYGDFIVGCIIGTSSLIVDIGGVSSSIVAST